MAKQIWKPGNMLYPLPAVMVSTADKSGKSNIITVAWTGTVCTNPAMLYISVRPERYSYDLLKDSGEFVVNLTTEKLKKATDWCGVRSGRDVDKWKEMLTPYLPEVLEKNGVQMVFFMLTDILDESTELLCCGAKAKEYIIDAFDLKEDSEKMILKGVVSRKKQLIPTLVSELQQ